MRVADKLGPQVLVLVARSKVPLSPISSPAIRRRALRMLQALKLERAELSILLCDDRTIHALNREHRRKDKPTDVLAFAMHEGEEVVGDQQLLGDVVISLQTARRQAKDHARSLWAEVTMLLAHGLLHLVGYDHRTDKEEREMDLEVDRLCAAVKMTGGALRKSPLLAPNVTRAHVDKRAAGIVNGPSKQIARPTAR